MRDWGNPWRIDDAFEESQGHSLEGKVPLASLSMKPSHMWPQRSPSTGFEKHWPTWLPKCSVWSAYNGPKPFFLFVDYLQCPLKAEATGPFLSLDTWGQERALAFGRDKWGCSSPEGKRKLGPCPHLRGLDGLALSVLESRLWGWEDET